MLLLLAVAKLFATSLMLATGWKGGYLFPIMFANLAEIPQSHTPLKLVRSAADAVTGRTAIRSETFASVNEALWAPDASGIVLVESGDPANWVGGGATFYPIGGGTPVKLLPAAGNLRWGP
jgi:hypothetical protein